MLKCIYTSTKLVSTTTALYKSIRTIGWSKETNSIIGNLRVSPTHPFSMFDYHSVARVFRDATTAGLGGFYSSYRADYYIPDKSGTYYGVKVAIPGVKIKNVDKFAGVCYGDGLFSNRIFTTMSRDGCIDVVNGHGYCNSGTTVKKIDLSTDTVLSTFTVAGLGYSNFFWTKQGYILAINNGSSNDTVIVFSPVDGSIILVSSLPSTFVGAVTDLENDLLITIHSDYSIKIYILESSATNISAVTKEHATVKSGVGETFSVTITGDGGDGVPDIWVRWYLTPNLGSLYREYSKTNANGVASMLYYPPVAPGDTVTVNAEVSI
jgi:hypothetical protein